MTDLSRKVQTAAALAVAWLAFASPAGAQMSEADLVIRIERLENQIRQLTGTVEQLQYRNQQLEELLRRAQQADVRPSPGPAPRPMPPVAAAVPPPATAVLGIVEDFAGCVKMAGTITREHVDALRRMPDSYS